MGEARLNGGGTYFDTGGEAWDAVVVGLNDRESMTLGWQVNEQFLITQMEAGVARIDYILDRTQYSSLEDMAQRREGLFPP